MKLKPYADAILQTEQDEAKALAPARAEETKAKLSMKLAELSILIKRQELATVEAGGRYPLDIDALVTAQDELVLLSFTHDRLKSIAADLFPA
jgi:hypothetical protein